MGVNIGSTAGYFYLDSWVLACVLYQGTARFCSRYFNHSNDPCGRQYDQMVQAARSVYANIAEGSSRHQTSNETEMRLVDVARGSVNELASDFMNVLVAMNRCAWKNDDKNAMAVRSIILDRPEIGSDIVHDVTSHLITQVNKFQLWFDAADISISCNALLLICGRINAMLTKQLSKRLELFKQTGGFTENMSQERLTTLKSLSQDNSAPKCPKCGAIMFKRMARKGVNTGKEFWSCSNFRSTGCSGTRPLS